MIRRIFLTVVLLLSHLVSAFSVAEADEVFQERLISQGYSNVCAVDYYESLQCWGDNRSGQSDVPSDLGPIKALTSGDFFNCVIKQSTTISCWGEWYWGQDYSIYVPSSLASRKNATQIDANSSSVCAAFDNRYIYCWGSGGNGTIWRSFDYGSSTIVQLTDNCVLDTSGAVNCVYPKVGWVTALPSSAQVVKIVYTRGTVCALDKLKQVLCFENYYYDRLVGTIEQKAEEAQNIFSGDSMTCAVLVGGTATCWDMDDLSDSPVTSLTGIQQISIGSFGDCAYVQSEFVCPEVDSSLPHLGKDVIPTDLPSFEAKNIGQGKVKLSFFFDEMLSKYGEMSWTISDSSGSPICRFSQVRVKECVVTGLRIGNTYDYKLVGQNRSGFTKPVLLKKFKHCPIKAPSMTTKVDKKVVSTKSSVTISGHFNNLCVSYPLTFQSRFKDAGGIWSSWSQGKVNTAGKFNLKRTINFNTSIEIKGVTRDGNTLTSSLSVGARIQKVLPLSFTWKATKNKQGFSQGGIVDIAFSGDSIYSGSCMVLGKTDDAYNFALTYMGSESRFSQFNVKKGRGSGSIQMNWNGKSNISVLCSSSKFQDVFDFRLPVFKANF